MRTKISRTVLVVTGVLAAVTAAACTTGFSGATALPTTVDTTIAPPPPTQVETKKPAVVVNKTTRTPECRSSGLKLSLRGVDAAMSHDFSVLRFTNVSGHSCVIVGFPGVSYVAGDKGTQVGALVVRDGHIGKQITLAPGKFASTVIDEVNIGVFDADVCRPTAVRGFRVYPPDETAAMFLPLPAGTRACAATKLPANELTVETIQPGNAVPTQY